jgi:hypothetical protein
VHSGSCFETSGLPVPADELAGREKSRQPFLLGIGEHKNLACLICVNGWVSVTFYGGQHPEHMSISYEPQYKTTHDQALVLMREAKQTDPNFVRFYWFPHEQEVRLVEVADDIPTSETGAVEPFYFPPAPDYQMPALSGVAVISSKDDRRLTLPAAWGDWSSAVELSE